jgi:FtsH-binding integral membrane protein
MLNARIGLILTGLAFGIWEAVDIFWIDVPAMAALFAALFFGCTLWFWRRNSVWAAAALMLLFAFEAAAAPSLKHVMTVTKAADLALAIAGVACALAVLIATRRSKRSSGRGLAEAG